MSDWLGYCEAQRVWDPGACSRVRAYASRSHVRLLVGRGGLLPVAQGSRLGRAFGAATRQECAEGVSLAAGRSLVRPGACLAHWCSRRRVEFRIGAIQNLRNGEETMPLFTTSDGTEIYYKDWGDGQPIVFSHVKLVQHGTLKTYPGFPHGMPTTHADTINADLLAFLKS
jgi:hypothetical protein